MLLVGLVVRLALLSVLFFAVGFLSLMGVLPFVSGLFFLELCLGFSCFGDFLFGMVEV